MFSCRRKQVGAVERRDEGQRATMNMNDENMSEWRRAGLPMFYVTSVSQDSNGLGPPASLSTNVALEHFKLVVSDKLRLIYDKQQQQQARNCGMRNNNPALVLRRRIGDIIEEA